MTHLFGTDDGEDVAVQRVVVREGGAALVGEGDLDGSGTLKLSFGVGWCGLVWCGVVWCVSEQCVEMSSSGRQVRGTA